MEWFEELSVEERMSALKNVAAMMAADGKIEESEKQLLAGICGRLGVTAKDVEAVIRNPAKYAFVVPRSDREKVFQLVDSVFMMIVDGNIDANEMELCLRLAQALGFNPAIVPKVIAAIVEAIEQGHNRGKIGDLTASLLQGNRP